MNETTGEMVRTALELLGKGDHKTAEELLRQAADTGDAEACRILAREYRHGFHFSVDGDNEIHYMQLAAEKGSLIDCCFMAIYTASGIEPKIKKDRIKAEKWLEPVKEHPAASAICQLFGLSGCEKDNGAAMDFFREIVVEQYGQPDEANWLYIFTLAMGVISPRISPDQDAAQEYLISYAFTASLRLSELNSKAGYAEMGIFLTVNGGYNFDPEQEKMIVEQLERGVAGNDYDCMHSLGLYLLKHDQVERGKELIRKAAEHDTVGAVCKAALLDLEEGADPEQVLQKLEKSIEMGDDEALVPAAKLLESRDESKALEYIRKAANSGNAEGMVMLGNAYMNGWVLKKDPERAVQCFRDAAAEDYADGHCHLGLAFLRGDGVTADPFAAFGHLSYAADVSNDPHAWMELGRMWIEGVGCVKSPEKGLDCLNKAIEQDYAPAMYFWCNYCLEDPAKDPDWLCENVLPKLKKAADKGVAPAQNSYGIILLNGVGCDADQEKAAEYFDKAAKQGDADANYWLGFMNLHGIGMKLDEQKAREYFAAALENGGHPKAGLELGKFALKAKDYISAYQLFSDASKQESAEATRKLAEMFEKGLGMPKDPERAKELMEQAAEQENPT